jgi:hypothetical protein
MPSREVPLSLLHERVNGWYAEAGRKHLPWREPDASAWGVFLSEVMSQQTPLARVEPIWREWMDRWPTPTDLAAAAPGDAVRAWGRLGYPRRALRLQGGVRERQQMPRLDICARRLRGADAALLSEGKNHPAAAQAVLHFRRGALGRRTNGGRGRYGAAVKRRRVPQGSAAAKPSGLSPVFTPAAARRFFRPASIA